MAFNYEYPYSDVKQNADWILAKIRELDEKFNGELAREIRKQLDKLFIDSTYDEETETLTLVLDMEE